jgi:opacity protein-like surface antigen
VGYGFNDLRGASYFQGSNANEVDFESADLRDAFTVGGGVGYQINSYLRTDVTLDYLAKSDFDGSTVGSCGVAANCTSNDISSMTAWSLMANAYVDLGTYGYFTPYLGAGIGGTYVNWKNLQNTSCETGNSSNCDPTVTHGGDSNWRFSYALMAGASIDVTCNVKADVGYRFLHVNGGEMFGYNLNGGPGRDKGFNVHEARIGARYLFGGCQTAAYEPPPEIPLQQPVYK